MRRGTRAQRQHRLCRDAREHHLRDRCGHPAGVLEHAAPRMRAGRHGAPRYRPPGRGRNPCRHREHAGDRPREVGALRRLARVDRDRGALLGQHGRYPHRRPAGASRGHRRPEHRLRRTRLQSGIAQQPSRTPPGAEQAVSCVREHEGRGQPGRLSRLRHRLRRHQSRVAGSACRASSAPHRRPQAEASGWPAAGSHPTASRSTS